MGGGDYIYSLAFYVTAAVAVASAFMVVWHKHPVINALYLVVCFFSVAVAYVLLSAHFLAAIQVLVYAGAILVLFVMIIMLLDLRPEQLGPALPTVGKSVGVAAGFGVILMMVVLLHGISPTLNRPGEASAREVSLLLLALGEDPKAITGKPEYQDVNFQSRQVCFVSGNLLSGLSEPGAMAALREYAVKDPVTGASAKKFPPRLNTMTDQKLRKLAEDVSGPLSRLDDLSKFEVPPEYPEVTRDDLIQLIRATALARLELMTRFGTTAAVGRLVFSRYFLPFEAAGVLLLAAIVGVMVLARRPSGGSR